MKKIFVLAVAVAALTFTNCGNKNAGAADGADTVQVAATDVEADAQAVISELTKNVEAKDAKALQATIETVRQKAAEYLANNPEQAKEYLTQVQTYLKENAESVKAAVGNNEVVNTAITTLTPTSADDIVSTLSATLNNAAADAQAAGEAKVEEAKTKAAEKVNEAANKVVEDAKAKANEAANKAVEDAKAKANEAAKQAGNDLKKGLGL